MTPEVTVLLNLAQVALTGGLIWGLISMGGSVITLRDTAHELTVGLRTIGAALTELAGRVLVLEDRRL